MPHIDALDSLIIKRSVGEAGSREQLGAGLLHKDGVTEDIYDRSFAKYAMVYVVRGRGEYRDASGNSYPLGAGSVFQRFPGVPHATELDARSRWAEVFLDMGPRLAEGLIASRFIPLDRPVFQVDKPSGVEWGFLEYLRRLQDCPEEDLSRMIPRMLDLMQNTFDQSRESATQDADRDMVRRAQELFLSQCEGRPNIEAFCRERGWGYERFRKVFKKHTGLSPGRFLVRRRIDRACEYLLSGDEEIKEIAVRLGYASPYEFSGQFKRYTGMSPRDYRLRMR